MHQHSGSLSHNHNNESMQNETLTPLEDLLQTTVVVELIENISPDGENIVIPPVVELDADDNVADALRVLSANKILSAPVFSKEQSTYVGFVDMLDLVSFCLKEISQTDKSAEAIDKIAHQVATSKVKECIGMIFE